MQEVKGVFNSNPWVVALIVGLAYLISIYAKHELLITEDMLFQEFKGEDFDRYLEGLRSFRRVKYSLLVLFFSATIVVTSGLFLLGTTLFQLGFPTRVVFNVCSFASCSEIVKEFVIFFWFKARGSFVSSEVFNLNPLSVFSLVDNQEVGFPLSYALQSVDLFHLLKIIVIIASFRLLSGATIGELIKVVTTCYILPLILFFGIWYIFM